MLFFLNLDGTMKRQDSTRIFQGSTQVPDIQILSAVSADSGALQIAFTKPDGLVTQYFPLAITSSFVNEQGFTTYVWGIRFADEILRILGNITEQEGTVGISVQQVNAQTGGVVASYTASFEVEYSALPVPANDYTEDDIADLIALLNAYYAQNVALLQSIGGDYSSLVARLDQAEDDIDVLETRTTNPLLGDITFDLENNVGTKYFKDGTTATFQIANSYQVIQRDNFLKILSFTALSGWTQQTDGTYELGFAPTQTERSNANCIIALDVPATGGFEQTANGVFKGSDGSVLIYGANAPYEGRLCILAGSGSGTQIFNGTAVSSSTLTTSNADLLANAFVDDYYYNTTTGDWLQCTAKSDTITTWVYLCNFKVSINLNGTVVPYGSTATIYAPGGGGTQGYVLFASGANQSPAWGSLQVNGANVANKSFFAPTAGGSSGQVLLSRGGGTSAPQFYDLKLNGSNSAGNKTWYAPTTAGTSGYICTSAGSGAPTWKALTFTTSNDGLTVTLALGGTTIGSFTVAQETYLDNVTYNGTTHVMTFTYNTASGQTAIDVDLSGLVDTYTAGNGLQLSSGAFSVKLKSGESNLVVDSTGLSLSLTNILAKNGTATLAAASWTLSGSVYTQSVTVSNVGANDTLLVAGASATDCANMQDANIYYATASGTTATFTAESEPTSDIAITYTIMRGQA